MGSDAGASSDKSLFVVSPIGKLNSDIRKHADMVFHGLIEPVAKECGYIPARADHFEKPGMITDHIINAIIEADVCIVDLTFLNPNVFYELGVRHYTGRPTIHLASEETDLPFDNIGAWTIKFDLLDWHSQEAARKGMRGALVEIQKPNFQVSNPIIHANAIKELSRSEDPEEQVLPDILRRIEILEAKPKGGRSKLNVSYSRRGDQFYVDRATTSNQFIEGFEKIHASTEINGEIESDLMRSLMSHYDFPSHFVSELFSAIDPNHNPIVEDDGAHFVIYADGIPF